MEYRNLATNPILALLQIINTKWKFLIIKKLIDKRMRFSELKKVIGCTAKVLTKSLKELENDNLIIREKDEKEYNKVDYYLTDLGYTLRPVIDIMEKWGKEYKKLRKLQEKYLKK